MLISIHDLHGYLNLIAINQSNQQFRGAFLIERTVVNTLFYLVQTKSRDTVNMNIN